MSDERAYRLAIGCFDAVFINRHGDKIGGYTVHAMHIKDLANPFPLSHAFDGKVFDRVYVEGQRAFYREREVTTNAFLLT